MSDQQDGPNSSTLVMGAQTTRCIACKQEIAISKSWSIERPIWINALNWRFSWLRIAFFVNSGRWPDRH